jgi:hypothetical protein
MSRKDASGNIALSAGGSYLGSRIMWKMETRFSAPRDALLKGLSIGSILKVGSTFGSGALASDREKICGSLL